MHITALILFILFTPFLLAANTSSTLHLSPAEKAFVVQEKPITYTYDPDWTPFEWQNGINEHVGMVADILV